jgi:hypothetical protein
MQLYHFFKYSSRRAKKIYFAVGSFLFFLVMLYYLYVEHNQKEQRRIIDQVLKADSTDIISMTVLPLSHGSSLTDRQYEITNPLELNKVANALKQYYLFSPNHPSTKWSAVVHYETKKGTITFEVINTTDSENGTLLYFWSHATYGWNYAEYRSDKLGKLLETIVSEKSSSENNSREE